MVRKRLIDKVMFEKRSKRSEALHHIPERSNPSRKDPNMAGYSVCCSDGQETSALGTT